MTTTESRRRILFNVILSAAKIFLAESRDASGEQQILRVAQDDKMWSYDSPIIRRVRVRTVARRERVLDMHRREQRIFRQCLRNNEEAFQNGLARFCGNAYMCLEISSSPAPHGLPVLLSHACSWQESFRQIGDDRQIIVTESDPRHLEINHRPFDERALRKEFALIYSTRNEN